MDSHPSAARQTARPTIVGALSFLPLGELSLFVLGFALLAMVG